MTLVTARGVVLHTAVAELAQSTRGTWGQIVMEVPQDDRLSAVVRIPAYREAETD